MMARVRRIYFEEIEEIMENIADKISEIENLDYDSEYYEDRKKALTELYNALEDLAGV